MLFNNICEKQIVTVNETVVKKKKLNMEQLNVNSVLLVFHSFLISSYINRADEQSGMKLHVTDIDSRTQVHGTQFSHKVFENIRHNDVSNPATIGANTAFLLQCRVGGVRSGTRTYPLSR